MLANEPVHEVARDTAEDQAKRKLTEQGVRVEVVTGKIKDEKRRHGENGEQFIAAGKLVEQTPRGTSVSPVNELEKATDHHFFLRVTKVFEHGQLRELVQCQHGAGHDGHSSGWS